MQGAFCLFVFFPQHDVLYGVNEKKTTDET